MACAAVNDKGLVRCHETQGFEERLSKQQSIKWIGVIYSGNFATAAACFADTASSRNPLASIAAANASGSPVVFPSRVLVAISQVDAAETQTTSAEARRPRAAVALRCALRHLRRRATVTHESALRG